MNQIATVLAPTALPNVAGALMHAETTATQGANFADMLAQFREAMTYQLAGSDATPDANASATTETSTTPGQSAIPPDMIQATPPAKALSPLDILALPPSGPRTDPHAIGEGGAAIIPPQLALLQFVFPAAHAQPLTEITAPTAQPNANGVDALGLRGALLPKQAITAADGPTTQPPVQAPQLVVPKPARPAAVVADTQAEPTPASYKASDTAVDHAAAPVALLTVVPKLKPAGAPQPPSAPPVHQDPTATSTTAQPLATVPAPTLPALVNPQAFAVAVAAAPQAGVTIDALAVHVARKFQEGSSQFEIRLQPMELGRLDISLTVAEDGRVQAVLRIERPETLDMLQRDARLLEQQLRQAGLEVGSNALSFSLSNGNGQRPAPFTAWPAFADAQNAAGAAKDEAASTYIAVRTRDGVDIRV